MIYRSANKPSLKRESKMSKNRISLCNIPRQKPLIWIDFIDQNNESVKELNQFIDSLPVNKRLLLIGKIQELMEMASLGKIPKSSWQLENIAMDPDLFELKWKFMDKEITHIRQYHAEPERVPRVLVALHAHIKETLGSLLEIRVKQNVQIAFARARFNSGQKNQWVV